MEDNKTMFYIVAIVAVVAIFGMVFMTISVNNAAKTTEKQIIEIVPNADDTVTIYEGSDAVGYAMSAAQCCAIFQTKTCCLPR